MKDRPKGFLEGLYSDHGDREVASYITELHEYLWAFVRCEFPWATGNLQDFVDNALEQAKYRYNNRSEFK